MIWAIALHEWRRLRSSLLFWLLLAFAQLVIGWLTFAQLEAFAEIAPQIKASASTLGTMDLVITPTLNSLVLLLLLAIPLLAMGSLAGETRSGRMALWLSAPVSSSQIILGKTLGLWFASLPLLLSAALTLMALGLGVALDWPRCAAAFGGLVLFSLWLSCVAVLLSGLFDHPAAALAASYGVLLSLWLLDSLSEGTANWHWFALMPHLTPWFEGLVRSQDLAFFLGSGSAAVLAASFGIARRRGEI